MDEWMDVNSKWELCGTWVFPWGRFRGLNRAVSAVNHSHIMLRSGRPIQRYDHNNHGLKTIETHPKEKCIGVPLFSHAQRCSSLSKYRLDQMLDASAALIHLRYRF